MQRLTVLCVLMTLLSAGGLLPAADVRVTRNLPYSEAGGRLTQLDVYTSAEGTTGRPVMIWIHGGGWRRGDKFAVQEKPAAFIDRGFVLVSVNYRLVPEVTFREQGADIAKAIAWVRSHISEYGGDPEKLFLMGHSAGAHLAALVATDQRYLAGEKLEPGSLKGVILLDGAGYDVPRQIERARLPRLKEIYLTAFGEDEAVQREASPITHVAKGKRIPPFLILYVASRRDAMIQSTELAARLNDAGVKAKVIPAEGKTHGTINRELGEPDDVPTKAVFDFLEERLADQPADAGAKTGKS